MASPYPGRISRLRERLADEKLDGLLVSSLPNVHYLTGFSGSAGALLVGPRGSTLFTDPRYDLQAHEEAQGSRVTIVKGDAFAAAAKRAAGTRVARLGFESEAVSFGLHRKLRQWLPGKRLVPAAGLVEALRMQKDEEEIEKIRRAVEMGSRAFTETIPLLRPGITEQEVAAEIEYRMRLYGGERPAFETIVAFGPRTALPHARPGPRPLRQNECILLDLGVILDGYASDMTRTLFLGSASRKAARIYQAVLEAQQEAEAVIRAGVKCSAVDEAARRVLARWGYASFFTHSTGHGLGREIHEMPRIAQKQSAPLVERAVVTVEPGVYIPGFGGVRIEDVVVVRREGAELLTTTPKELTML
jgi:Xaa-Pro aminopeptidase